MTGVLTPDTATKYSLGFVFDREVGKQDQLYTFDYQTDVKLTVAKTLGSASFSTTLGSQGKASLKFAATGPLKKVSQHQGTLLGCTLPKKPTRAGSVTGTLKFKTGTVFGTISAAKLKATLSTIPTGGKCKSETSYDLTLNGAGDDDSNTLFGFTSPSYTGVAASYLKIGEGPTSFTLDGQISESEPTSIFTHSGLESAKIAVSGSFMSGTATYKKTKSCDRGKASSGTVTGSIKAHFLIGGTMSYPADGVGILGKNYGTCE